MRAFALAFTVLSFATPGLEAQDSIPIHVIRVIKDSSGKENYIVQVRGQTMYAISEAQLARSQDVAAQLKGALARIKVLDSLIPYYDDALARSDTMVRRQRILIGQLDSLSRGWRDVAGGWRRLAGEPLLTFDWGLGATGKDRKPAVLAGFGIRRFRAWGILQEANAGAAVGMSLRLF